MIEKCLMNFGKRLIIQRLCQIDAEDFGAERPTQGFYFNMAVIGSHRVQTFAIDYQL
jgi:hypothetical protein